MVAFVQNYDDLKHCYHDDSNSVNVDVSTHTLPSDCKIRNHLGDRLCDSLAPAACPAVHSIVTDRTSNWGSGITGAGRGDVLGGGGVGGTGGGSAISAEAEPESVMENDGRSRPTNVEARSTMRAA
jgi:hypothetical protein